MAPRDEEAVDKIFSGCLENLPPLSSKVSHFNGLLWFKMCLLSGCEDIYQLNLHWHVDGEKYFDGTQTELIITHLTLNLIFQGVGVS